jgi:hypothetical protein
MKLHLTVFVVKPVIRMYNLINKQYPYLNDAFDIFILFSGINTFLFHLFSPYHLVAAKYHYFFDRHFLD